MTARDFENKVLSLSPRIYPMVVRILGSVESAEDAVQEIMIKLWDRRRKLATHPNINGFVFVTARNYCLDQLKKKIPSIDSSELQLKMLTSDVSQDQMEWIELKKIIEEILGELPDQQREVMMMRDIDGLEFLEIVAATNLKIEHVRVLLSRARKRVSLKLKNVYHYE